MAVTSCQLRAVTGTLQRVGRTARALFHAHADAVSTGLRVIEECQAITATGNTPVPIIGAQLDYTLNQVQHFYPTLFAETIDASMISEDKARLKWLVRVEYANPSLSSAESPGTPPDQEKEPTAREAMYWSESIVVSEPIMTGRNVQKIKFPWKTGEPNDKTAEPADREANTNGFITNAAGVPAGAAESFQRRLTVLVFKKFVRNPFEHTSLNDKYENTLNTETWKIFGKFGSIQPRRARYWYAVTNGPLYWGKDREIYFELEVRVIYDPREHRISVPNVGQSAWQKADDQIVLAPVYLGGTPAPMVPLSDKGTRFFLPLSDDFFQPEASKLEKVEYDVYDTTDYNKLNEDLNNIGKTKEESKGE